MEAGLTAKSGNIATIVKQMTPVILLALMCGTTFTDALGTMGKPNQVIALLTMRWFAGMQPKISSAYSTTWRFNGALGHGVLMKWKDHFEPPHHTIFACRALQGPDDNWMDIQWTHGYLCLLQFPHFRCF